MMTRLAALFLSVLIFFTVVEFIRKEKLTFKYAFGWLIISSLGVFFSLFDETLWFFSELFDFTLMSNFIFFCLIGMLILMSLLMTMFLCQQNRHNDIIAQKIAMLEHEIKIQKHTPNDMKDKSNYD